MHFSNSCSNISLFKSTSSCRLGPLSRGHPLAGEYLLVTPEHPTGLAVTGQRALLCPALPGMTIVKMKESQPWFVCTKTSTVLAGLKKKKDENISDLNKRVYNYQILCPPNFPKKWRMREKEIHHHTESDCFIFEEM